MFIDPQTISWLVIGAASFCAFMIGKHYGSGEKEDTIAHTIEYLIEQGFLKARKTMDGEYELIHPEDEK